MVGLKLELFCALLTELAAMDAMDITTLYDRIYLRH